MSLVCELAIDVLILMRVPLLRSELFILDAFGRLFDIGCEGALVLFILRVLDWLSEAESKSLTLKEVITMILYWLPYDVYGSCR